MSLIDRLTTAIAAKEAKARAATPGPWFTPPTDDIAEWTIYGNVSPDRQTGWAIASTMQYPREDMSNEATALRKPAEVVEHANANAEHIADNDPASVLALCQAHREIVDEYLRVLKDRKKRHGDLGLAGALLALHGVVGIVARGYGITEEDTCD